MNTNMQQGGGLDMNGDEDEERQRFSFRKTIKEFAENTTAHGFSNLARGENIVLKIIWIVIMLACFIALCIQIYPLVMKYQSIPVSTRLSLIRKKHLQFPVIVLCNQNMIKKSMYHYLQPYLEMEDREEDTVSFIAETNPSELLSLGHQFDETVVSCNWKNSYPCLLDKWRIIWNYKYGVCFVFNSAFSGGKLIDQELLHSVERTGPNSGLEIVLDIDKDEYLAKLTDSAGMRLYIGDQGALYSPFTEGISVAPGFSYSISLKKEIVKRTDPYNNGTCVRNKIVPLSNDSLGQHVIFKYTKNFCYQECLSNQLLLQCDCAEFWLPKLVSDIPSCSKFEYRECAKNVRSDWESGYLSCLKWCNPPCHEVKYIKEVSMHRYPVMGEDESAERKVYEEENIMKLSIYFRDLEYNLYEDYKSYEIENLLADIGGQLGLFSGLSILTVVEIIILFAQCLAYVAYKISSRKNKISNVA